MRICKICGEKKPMNEFTSYKNYPIKFRQICRECENRKARERGQNFRKELIRLNTEEVEIIKVFNTLKSADKMLNLLIDGYDVSWSGEGTVIFNKAGKIVHAKNATKEIYEIIFARYCIELEKRLVKR